MNCHNCGGRLEKVITDLPFKIGHSFMEKVDRVLSKSDGTAELEILN
jgi:hypothetical protein